eukprot:403366381
MELSAIDPQTKKVNRKFIQNAALKFRRKLININGTTATKRNENEFQRSPFNEQQHPVINQRYQQHQTVSPRPPIQNNQGINISGGTAIQSKNQTFIAENQKKFNDLHLPSTFEISPNRPQQNGFQNKTPIQLKSKAATNNIKINFMNGKLEVGNQTTLTQGQQNSSFIIDSNAQKTDSQQKMQLLLNSNTQQPQSKSQNRDKLSSKFNRHSRMNAQQLKKNQVQKQMDSNRQNSQSQTPISNRSQHRDNEAQNTSSNNNMMKMGNQTLYPHSTNIVNNIQQHIIGGDMQVLQFNLGNQITPKQQQAIINMTQIGWNNQTNINIINNQGGDASIYNTARRGQGGVGANQNLNQQLKDIFNNNQQILNSTRLNDRKQKLVINNNTQDLTIPSLGVTGYGTSTNASIQNQLASQQRRAQEYSAPRQGSNHQTIQQFPPVFSNNFDHSDTQIQGSIQKIREGHSKRSSNRTIQDNQQLPQQSNVNLMGSKTIIDRNGRSGSSINTNKDINSSQTGSSANSFQRKYATNSDQKQKIQFPISGEDAYKLYFNQLNPYEREEVKQFQQVYFVSTNIKRKQVLITGDDGEARIMNHGYDGEDGEYLFESGEQINYRYEIIKKLGRGAFGVVVKCLDHQTKEVVALKILKNQKKLHKQGKIEIKLLELLRDNDPEDKRNCICFEMLSINLYQFIKNNEFQGFSVALTKRFTTQILQALAYLFKFNIVHCDLKPENVLLKKPNKSNIKLIDFGSSCFEQERYYTYIQSRFYRAPEIMLGIAYTPAIDMWSLGCIVFECLIGIPIFAGENERDQMAAIMEVTGLPPRSLIAKASRRKVFFDDDYNPIIKVNSRGKLRKPGSRSIESIIKVNDPDLVQFLKGCFEWKPEQRLKPEEGIKSPWIQKALMESRLKKQSQNTIDQ